MCDLHSNQIPTSCSGQRKDQAPARFDLLLDLWVIPNVTISMLLA